MIGWEENDQNINVGLVTLYEHHNDLSTSFENRLFDIRKLHLNIKSNLRYKTEETPA